MDSEQIAWGDLGFRPRITDAGEPLIEVCTSNPHYETVVLATVSVWDALVMQRNLAQALVSAHHEADLAKQRAEYDQVMAERNADRT